MTQLIAIFAIGNDNEIHMKAFRTITFGALALFSLHIQAKDDIVKTGWNFLPLPVVAFDTDMGFQYGASCEMVNFGDGSDYPRYKYKMNCEASAYTKGTKALRFNGEFMNVIDDGKMMVECVRLNSPLHLFYGYNGLASAYDQDFRIVAGTPLTDRSAYNFMSRDLFRFVVSMSRKIVGNWSWGTGVSYYHYAMGAIDRNTYDQYSNQTTLYDSYVKAGLIRENEKGGGNVTVFKGSVLYDSRDLESDPTHGIYAEATISAIPDIIDRNGYGHVSATMSFSQFIPLYSDRIIFAYRGFLQHKLCGEIPYYFTTNTNSLFYRRMYTEAVGGYTSVRGTNRNGITGTGFAFVNTELRLRLIDFKLLNQNFQIAMNPFFDAGRITQPYRLDEQKKTADSTDPDIRRLWSGQEEDMHYTSGLGFKIIMNRNMVLSAEAAKAFEKNDGSRLWTNIGFNYTF